MGASGFDVFTDYSCDTFASEWTQCSNVSFNRFMRSFRSDSALHKDMLAVLAAVTEVIKENGGTETPTEYYCALLTALDQALSTSEGQAQVAPILALLDMGVKKVPVPVLRKSFSNLAPKLMHILSEFSSSENNVVMKSTFGILATLLEAQEPAAWTSSDTTKVFATILNPFCIHSKPKVNAIVQVTCMFLHDCFQWRKSAVKAAISVVASSDGPHVARNEVAKFCEEILASCMGENSASVNTGQKTILHVLGLMKFTVHYFSESNIKVIIICTLRLKVS